ncbi:MAG: hypothetical protein RLZZ618_2736 [Pseudomonadota bacterium]|jgi:diguanylate cyclase (GGDEF)-like protein
MTDKPAGEGVAGAEGLAVSAVTMELKSLRRQALDVRAELAGLLADLAQAESRLGSSESRRLLEANEQLVLSVLKAQADSEAAVQAFSMRSRTAALDDLTQLPNRALLLDRFAKAISSAKRRHAMLAVLFLDLNNFKQINDTLGHEVGDEVLKLVADGLLSVVRDADTVSRFGGDEFLVLLLDVSGPRDASVIADKIIASLSAPRRMGEHVMRVSTSIGISLYPNDGHDAATLIRQADAAMYRAKRRGFGNYAFHHQLAAEVAQDAKPQVHAPRRKPVAHDEESLAEQERHHAQLREANEQLVLAVIDAQELQAAAERAQQRQTEVLAVVAHELRHPLTPIRNAASLMDHIHTDGAMLPRLQRIIERQVVHLSRLVEDLLDVSRVNTNKLRLQRCPVDMAELVDDALDACRPDMDARMQRVVVHIDKEAMVVDADPVRLTQVLSNLLGNASKYSMDSRAINLSVVGGENDVVLTVSDEGIGIHGDSLPRIFDAFTQDTHAIGFNGVGLGIGLTVVRAVVEAHGGTVVASSAGVGLGSQFVVTLPRSAPVV